MSFESWLMWYSGKYGLRRAARPPMADIKKEVSMKLRVYPKADIESLKFNYNKFAQLGLADASPKGVLLSAFK